MSVVTCGRCIVDPERKAPGRFDSNGKPIRVAHYFPLAEHIKAVFASKALAKHAKYAWERPAPTEEQISNRELEDVWDGNIMDELYHNADPRIKPKSTGYTSLAFDGVELKKKVCTLPTNRHHPLNKHRLLFVDEHHIVVTVPLTHVCL